MRILLTGFEPFNGELINPSYEAIKLIRNELDDSEIIKLEIPTVFEQSYHKINEAVIEYNPQIILNVGQAAERYGITVEKVAINLIDSKIPDNSGNQPIDRKIQENGQNAYFSTIPVRSIVEKMKSNGIPASISYTAGTYVCNYVLYQNLYSAEQEKGNRKVGFIHVPYATIQGACKEKCVPTMSIEDMSRAIEIAIKVIIAEEK